VTEIVNSMFRDQRRKRQFAKKLRDNTTDSETEAEGEYESEEDTLNESTASELPTKLPQEEYFLWGAELSRSHDLHVLKLDDDVNEDEEHHLLFLKQVCLGVNAKEGDRNVVEIQTTDFSDKEQRHPIASLALGRTEFANLDLCLSWSKTKEIKFKLVMGSGPVTITGNHFVEYLAIREEEEEEEDPDYVAEETEDETEADLSTMEDLDENELQDLEKDAKDLNGDAKAINGGEGKRKRVPSPTESSPTKKQQKVIDDVSLKEVDLKA